MKKLLSIPLETDRTGSEDERSGHKSPGGLLLKVILDEAGKSPPSYHPGMESKHPPLAQLQMTFVTCYLPRPFPSSQYEDKPGGSGNLQGWLCPANPGPPPVVLQLPLHPPFLAPLRTRASSPPTGKAQEGTGSPPAEAFQIIVHSIASSSTYLSALTRNYSSDHLIPLWNVLISSSGPQCQSQMSFSHLLTEVKLPRSLIS